MLRLTHRHGRHQINLIFKMHLPPRSMTIQHPLFHQSDLRFLPATKKFQEYIFTPLPAYWCRPRWAYQYWFCDQSHDPTGIKILIWYNKCAHIHTPSRQTFQVLLMIYLISIDRELLNPLNSSVISNLLTSNFLQASAAKNMDAKILLFEVHGCTFILSIPRPSIQAFSQWFLK